MTPTGRGSAWVARAFSAGWGCPAQRGVSGRHLGGVRQRLVADVRRVRPDVCRAVPGAAPALECGAGGVGLCRLLPGAGGDRLLGVADVDDPGCLCGVRHHRPRYRNRVAVLRRTHELPLVCAAVRVDLGGHRSAGPGQRDHRHLLVDRLPHRRAAPVRTTSQRAQHARAEPATASRNHKQPASATTAPKVSRAVAATTRVTPAHAAGAKKSGSRRAA